MFDDGAAVQIGQRITLRGLPFRLAAGTGCLLLEGYLACRELQKRKRRNGTK